MTKNIKDYTIHKQILVPVSDKCPRAGQGSAELLKDGSILLAYGAFDGPSDHANAPIVSRISRDGGITWSDPEIMQSKGQGKRHERHVREPPAPEQRGAGVSFHGQAHRVN